MIIKMGKSNKPGFGYGDTGEGLINDNSEILPFSETREYYTPSHALYVRHSLLNTTNEKQSFMCKEIEA